MAEVQIKGQGLRQNLEILREEYGEEIVAKITERLSEDFRRALRAGTVLASGWYPVAWLNELHRASVSVLPHIPNLPELVGTRSVERDMQGVYGFLARFLAPEFCVRQAPRSIGTYLRGVRIEPHILAPGHAEIHFSNCAEFNRYLWRDIAASSALVLSKTGAKNVRVRFTQGGRDGDGQAVLDVRWE